MFRSLKSKAFYLLSYNISYLIISCQFPSKPNSKFSPPCINFFLCFIALGVDFCNQEIYFIQIGDSAEFDGRLRWCLCFFMSSFGAELDVLGQRRFNSRKKNRCQTQKFQNPIPTTLEPISKDRLHKAHKNLKLIRVLHSGPLFCNVPLILYDLRVLKCVRK